MKFWLQEEGVLTNREIVVYLDQNPYLVDPSSQRIIVHFARSMGIGEKTDQSVKKKKGKHPSEVHVAKTDGNDSLFWFFALLLLHIVIQMLLSGC